MVDMALSGRRTSASTLTDPKILGPALVDAFRKLDPRVMIKNPVMFTVEVVATLTTVLFIRDLGETEVGAGPGTAALAQEVRREPGPAAELEAAAPLHPGQVFQHRLHRRLLLQRPTVQLQLPRLAHAARSSAGSAPARR